MNITKRSTNGTPVLFVCLGRVEKRLEGTCFRQQTTKLAGNFNKWCTVDEVIGDDQLSSLLAEEVVDLFSEGELGLHSVTVSHPMNVGWASTDHLSYFSSDELEEFHPNSRSTALKVILPSKLGRKAPLTKDVTIIFILEEQRGAPKATLVSLYPGTDVGDLEGDITEREQQVFYDWSHPGE
jgi:hypothetical protein